MVQWLLRCTLVLSTLAAAPAAHAQYIFADLDDDGACTDNDVPGAGVDTIWVWLDTNRDHAGNEIACPTGQALSISGYEVQFYLASFVPAAHTSDRVVVGTWINGVPTFTVDGGQVTSVGGQDVHVSFRSPDPPAYLAPGRYRL